MDSRWTRIGFGAFRSGSDGTELKYSLGVQSWGLEVKELQSAIICRNRSSSNARVALHINLSAAADRPSLYAGSDLVTTTTMSGALPKTANGTPQALPVPYFEIVLGASSTAAQEDWVEVEVYVGGKQY